MHRSSTIPPPPVQDFAALPSKARKRRRLGGTGAADGVPRGPAGNGEIGILPLDTLRLAGSQRVGIIGLPRAAHRARAVRRGAGDG